LKNRVLGTESELAEETRKRVLASTPAEIDLRRDAPFVLRTGQKIAGVGSAVRRGKKLPAGFLGTSATNVSANDLMWEFFQKHKLK
jgi:poly(3-hydroxybutyrate) depolymerase